MEMSLVPALKLAWQSSLFIAPSVTFCTGLTKCAVTLRHGNCVMSRGINLMCGAQVWFIPLRLCGERWLENVSFCKSDKNGYLWGFLDLKNLVHALTKGHDMRLVANQVGSLHAWRSGHCSVVTWWYGMPRHGMERNDAYKIASSQNAFSFRNMYILL